MIGLLCLKTAQSGGASRIASSSAIVREIQRSRPDLYPVLFQDFPWHYQEEGVPALWFAKPICSSKGSTDGGSRINTFFIPWYIADRPHAHGGRPGAVDSGVPEVPRGP